MLGRSDGVLCVCPTQINKLMCVRYAKKPVGSPPEILAGYDLDRRNYTMLSSFALNLG